MHTCARTHVHSGLIPANLSGTVFFALHLNSLRKGGILSIMDCFFLPVIKILHGTISNSVSHLKSIFFSLVSSIFFFCSYLHENTCSIIHLKFKSAFHYVLIYLLHKLFLPLYYLSFLKRMVFFTFFSITLIHIFSTILNLYFIVTKSTYMFLFIQACKMSNCSDSEERLSRPVFCG